MPWLETAPMKQRLQFVKDYATELWGMTELCARYGISRKTGYKYLERAEREGEAGLKDRSRAPHHSPQRMAPSTEALLLECKDKHPTWGPRKIRALVERDEPWRPLPAVSTISELFDRHGLVRARTRRTRWKHPGRPEGSPVAPNDLWTADFKGQFRTGDGQYCYPLTVADQFSRYLLCCHALPSVRTEGAQPAFERLFRSVGLPRAIRTDNGAPFASTGIHGLCALNVWWMRLGIIHERIVPGQPQQNGAHERMHRTLKRDTARPPASNHRAQQARFDRFRCEFNTDRPHEALDNQTPGSLWIPSPRPYPSRILPPDYPGHFQVRRISNAGSFRLHDEQNFISHALAGDYIGLEEIHDGIWSVYYYDTLLARFDDRTRRLSA